VTRLATLAFVGASSLAFEPARAVGQTLVLAHARVLDASGERWLDDRAVVVRDGRIAIVAPTKDVDPSLAQRELADALWLDLNGRALIPGLVDLHTHLLLHPYDETPWDEQVLHESLELRTVRATVAARATLEAGFTTIRELGTEGAGIADVALRDSIRAGTLVGPTIVATTRAIVASSCYGPSGLDPRAQAAIPKGAQEASGADDVRRVVREQVAAGADWIKVYADYRRAKGDVATPTFTLDELRAAVDEAHSAGRKVAAHATTDEGIRRAVLAGVATIEHGDGASDATLALMKEKGVVLVPTLAAVEALALQSGWRRDTPRPPRFESALDVVRRAKSVGVTVANGSDAGVFAHGTNARELELLVAAGLTPSEALRAATKSAAGVLGAPIGTIAAGAAADVVALDGDPLADVAALRHVALVVKSGRVVVDHLTGERDEEHRAPRHGSAAEKESALAFCRRFLADYSAADFDAVAAAFAPDATVAVDDSGRGEARTLAAATFLERAKASRSKSGKLDESIVGTPVVLVDGAIATVWADFTVTYPGGSGHGTDVFQLAKSGGAWKVSSLAWTFRADER
jgi:imidazolonepropionase-like amidohydrolase/ketosteroid isomerase-like protein